MIQAAPVDLVEGSPDARVQLSAVEVVSHRFVLADGRLGSRGVVGGAAAVGAVQGAGAERGQRAALALGQLRGEPHRLPEPAPQPDAHDGWPEEGEVVVVAEARVDEGEVRAALGEDAALGEELALAVGCDVALGRHEDGLAGRSAVPRLGRGHVGAWIPATD